MQNAAFVDHFIPTGLHTADYELPGGQVCRVKEERNKVYYNVFRAK